MIERNERRLLGSLMVVGGATAVAGALLPWLTFYAGLLPMRGVRGLFGWLVLLGGAVAMACGLALLRGRAVRPALRMGAATGVILTAFTATLVPRLLATERRLLEHALMVPALGPGLFVALAGALLVASTAARWRRA